MVWDDPPMPPERSGNVVDDAIVLTLGAIDRAGVGVRSGGVGTAEVGTGALLEDEVGSGAPLEDDAPDGG